MVTDIGAGGAANRQQVTIMRRVYRQYGAEGAAVTGAKFEQAAALLVLTLALECHVACCKSRGSGR